MTDATGRLCVWDLEIVVADTISNNQFDAQGVLGLAPGSGKNSIVQALYDQGVIQNKIVGLNFENPEDNDQVSRVSFGEINYNEVEGGRDGLNYYQNLAIDKWGVYMDDILYNDVDISTGAGGGKIALIDSGSTSI
mmetsp:Transcript_18435/g.31531  ORF Transcript_18435/g.31531 Transcript_18435/m.31531 type:complete len:136 (+) Transcript_18435:464-871(+)